MPVSDEEIAFVHDLFDPLGQISHRKMMGGLSIYCAGQIFAILSSDGEIYLKAQGTLAAALEAAGSHKFATADGRGMHYWTLPDPALDDPELACGWARRALEAAAAR